MTDRIWSVLSKLLNAAAFVATITLIMAFCFSVGYHVGFKSGLDTKIEYVGEKYTMKLKGSK